MKFILILFVCINDPYLPIENTCILQPIKDTFDSMNECRLSAEYIYRDIVEPGIYMTSFCAQKNLTTT